MVSTRSLVRNMGLSLMLVFWCLSINLAPAMAAEATASPSTSAKTAKLGASPTRPLPIVKNPKAAASGPQARSYYGGGGFGGYGGHELFDRGFGGDLLPIFAIIGFAVIFLPLIGALMASVTQFAAPIGFPLNQAVTTATVAGRRRRDVQDQTVLNLMKGFDKFYKEFSAKH